MEKNCFHCNNSKLREPWENWAMDGCTMHCIKHNSPISPRWTCENWIEKEKRPLQFCCNCNHFIPVILDNSKFISKCLRKNTEILEPQTQFCEEWEITERRKLWQ